MHRSKSIRVLSVLALFGALASTGCGPKAARGGEGTDNPNMDQPALSTQLDLVDIQDLVAKNLNAMTTSGWWGKDVQAAADAPVVAIWPIMNASSEHIDDQMLALLSEIETTLVNSGAVKVVSRERQHEMAEEVGVQAGAAFDPATAAKVGRQVGAKYYITGKVTSTDERLSDTRRVQYSLFLQVIEVETSMIAFQFTSKRSKAVEG
jgi:hypothetical protein